MLILPIAQENSEVRRWPWISTGLIALNFAVFLGIALFYDEARAEREVDDQWHAVAVYVGAHPYLNLPPEVDQRLSPEGRQRLDRLRVLAEKDRPEDAVLANEQAELDGLGTSLARSMQRLPSVRWGYTPARPSPMTLLTSMFLHAGWMHILGNMLFFFLSGPFVEDRFGRPLFLGLYLCSGIAAALAEASHAPGSLTPMVGASGAIAGVMGAFLLRLGRSRIRFLILPFPLIPAIRFKPLLPAFVVLPMWLLQQLWYAQQSHAGGVAWWAHVGGFLFGFAAAGVLKLARIEETVIHPAIEEQISLTQHPALERATEARLRGDLPAARAAVREVLAAQPQNVEASLEAYEIASAGGDAEEVARAATRLVEAYVRSGETALALRIVREVTAEDAPGLPSRFYLTAGALLEKEGDGRGALELYERVLMRQPEDATAFRAWYRSAEVLRRGGDVRRAREAYLKARAHPACAGTLASTVDRALAELASEPAAPALPSPRRS